jgi:Arc/MetJ-type ribon-helix-helix transcriptional regulator
MRRITVSLDDSLVKLAEAEVAAGRAPSVSAWVAGAMRNRVHARAELIADLDELERRDPTSNAELAAIAHSLGVPRTVLARAFKRTRTATRRRVG